MEMSSFGTTDTSSAIHACHTARTGPPVRSEPSSHFPSSHCLLHNSPAAVQQETLRRIEVHTLMCLAGFTQLCDRDDDGSRPHANTSATSDRDSHATVPLLSSHGANGRRTPRHGHASHRDLTRHRHELLILAAIYSMTRQGFTCTQRDLYYHLVRHVPDQKLINDYIQRLVRLVQLPREALGVVAGARGFVYGTVRYRGTRLCGSGAGVPPGDDGMSIPVTFSELTARFARRGSVGAETVAADETPDCGAAFVMEPHTRAILVVEKHAVYHQLCLHRLVRYFPCVLVTSQGFPCLSARALVHALHTAAPHLPVVGLIDYNPAGLSILLQYKLGLGRMTESTLYKIPALRWLGVRARHVVRAVAVSEPSLHGVAETELRYFDDCLPHQPFTSRDTAMIANLETLITKTMEEDSLSRATTGDANTVALQPWLSEVKQMAAWGNKVELEALYTANPRAVSCAGHTPEQKANMYAESAAHASRGVSPSAFVEQLSRELLQHRYD